MDAKSIEHQNALKTIAIVARLLLPLDLPEMVQAMDRAEAFGCFVDPTLWREKIDALQFDRELAKAALPLWRIAQRLAAQPSTTAS